MKLRPLVAALAACVLLLTGCATVPTKGQLRSGNREGLADDQGGVGVEAKPPREGSDPTAIMAGFLEAMSDSNQFDTAREYMTPEAAANWQPEKQTIVYEQSPDSLTPKPGGFQLSARQIATIDDRGEWAPSRAESKTNFFFGIAKVNGQNRITTAPPGVLLANNQASLKLLSFDLYFFARDRKTLVPDPVYLPRNPSNGQTATLLVQELLKGPTKRLGNGVVSMAPPGTAIQVSVPVDHWNGNLRNQKSPRPRRGDTGCAVTFGDDAGWRRRVAGSSRLHPYPYYFSTWVRGKEVG